MTDRQECAAAVELAEWGGWPELQAIGESEDPFDAGSMDVVWRPKDRHFGVRHGGRLVAHAGFVVVPVEVGGRLFDVAGLGGVIVAPHLRGRGLARAVVTAALAGARADGLALALLFCLPDRAPLYARLGWTPLPDPVTADQPTGPATVPLGAMWTSLVPGARWPDGGAARLHSLPM